MKHPVKLASLKTPFNSANALEIQNLCKFCIHVTQQKRYVLYFSGMQISQLNTKLTPSILLQEPKKKYELFLATVDLEFQTYFNLV